VKSAREETTSSPEEKRQFAVQISLWFSPVNEGIGGGGLLYHECSLSQVTLESLVKGIKWQGKPKRKFFHLWSREREKGKANPKTADGFKVVGL
jgi:hypothetical protein